MARQYIDPQPFKDRIAELEGQIAELKAKPEGVHPIDALMPRIAALSVTVGKIDPQAEINPDGTLINAERLLRELRDEIEQSDVRLAGCLVAAEGNVTEVAQRGSYGWSPAYQAVLELRKKYDASTEGTDEKLQTIADSMIHKASPADTAITEAEKAIDADSQVGITEPSVEGPSQTTNSSTDSGNASETQEKSPSEAASE